MWRLTGRRRKEALMTYKILPHCVLFPLHLLGNTPPQQVLLHRPALQQYLSGRIARAKLPLHRTIRLKLRKVPYVLLKFCGKRLRKAINTKNRRRSLLKRLNLCILSISSPLDSVLQYYCNRGEVNFLSKYKTCFQKLCDKIRPEFYEQS